ncbi:leucine-rich repeat domain-containing protein [Streptomyces sp. NRRL S-495]|uniref:leucine-rich repeat domain-containing protein n=1 Tax=Streptomyces sp. NRRL S-495 TaxID=1609133 RepID=UPI00256FDD62|nr:leucine-rich repeat domain-containing protein [Streptomyces sp. NRRL S-495]
MDLPEPGTVAWRLAVAYGAEGGFDVLWSAFLEAVDPATVRGLLLGPWWTQDYTPVSEALTRIVADADRFPALEGLVIGDVSYEDCEISWLEMSDVTPALTAFPGLTDLVVRGLPAEVVRGVAASELPALESLELWFGVDEYGGDATIDDVAPLLTGTRLPALRHLGLQNSEFQDEIAAAVAHAPVVAQLSTLSLSMGVLSDEGAAALLDGQPLTHLKSLDLHHHYLTEAMQERVREALPGVDVDLSDAEEEDEDEWRYVEVSE